MFQFDCFVFNVFRTSYDHLQGDYIVQITLYIMLSIHFCKQRVEECAQCKAECKIRGLSKKYPTFGREKYIT